MTNITRCQCTNMVQIDCAELQTVQRIGWSQLHHRMAHLQQRRGGDEAAEGALARARHALPEGVRMRGRVECADLR